MRRFEPVKLSDGNRFDRRASQTLLRHFERCPRSGFLYQEHGSAPTAQMARGSALHEVQERVTRMMVDTGEPVVPPEVAKGVCEEVLVELHVPVEEHDSIREMTWRWASEFVCAPDRVVAVETLFEIPVLVPCLSCGGHGKTTPLPGTGGGLHECGECGGGGQVLWTVRCRIDFAEMSEDLETARVEDVKSSKAAVSLEEISRRRSDGSLHGKDFQLILYAIALAYGQPIFEQPCEKCEGEGEVAVGFALDSPGHPDIVTCPECEGKGTVEVRLNAVPVGGRAQNFELAFIYPAIEGREGKMIRRDVTLTRMEVETYRQSLTGLVWRLAMAERSGQWPALVSDAACGECPAASLCPIPVELRDHRGEIDSVEKCEDALELRHWTAKDQRARMSDIKAFVAENGPVYYGNGRVAEIVYSESTKIKDREAMFEAVDRAVRFGEPYEKDKFVQVVGSSSLKERDLTADEKLDLLTEAGSYGDAGLPAGARDFDPGGSGRADKPF